MKLESSYHLQLPWAVLSGLTGGRQGTQCVRSSAVNLAGSGWIYLPGMWRVLAPG